MTEVAAHWGRVVAWYEPNTPPGTLRLAPRIDEDLIQAAKAEMGLRLPEDVHACYSMHNGLDGSSLLHDGEFLSLEPLLGEHSTTPEPGEPGSDVAPHDPSRPIKMVWWSLRRVKIVDNSGDGVMVGLDPAPGRDGWAVRPLRSRDEPQPDPRAELRRVARSGAGGGEAGLARREHASRTTRR